MLDLRDLSRLAGEIEMLFVVQFNKQEINGLFYSLLQLITKGKNHTSSIYFHSIERNTLFNNYSLSQINNKNLIYDKYIF